MVKTPKRKFNYYLFLRSFQVQSNHTTSKQFKKDKSKIKFNQNDFSIISM